MKLRMEGLLAALAVSTFATAMPAMADETLPADESAYDEMMTSIDQTADDEAALEASNGDETAALRPNRRHNRDRHMRRDHRRHRDHDRGFRIRFGHDRGWWGPRWHRPFSVTCWARNAAGRTFVARGWGSPYSIQRRAVLSCRNHSRAPFTCRALGCR